ncbi:hypothetical protein HGM15179_021601 [Zosterops borbonicus]|uniref:Uncharacterized protein n=1 Tax=Zosterops borbonicus TaxID=364589 RepID=A0A8K1D813_9PASS|nr:hypothetical protein HGM15179_022009 [Zosterops borbonicus]TRZ05506.1 hypothetical protein HGM15179_021601 [Zosterops borbonicus]
MLEAQVAVVATLGELMATVTAPRSNVWPLLYQKSLHEDLRRLSLTLRDTLEHGVPSLSQCGVPSLSQVLTMLRFIREPTLDSVRASARAWRDRVDALEDSWFWRVEEAADLLDAWEDAAKATAEATTKATAEATTEATAAGLAGDPQDETASGGTAGDNLMAMAPQPRLSLAERKAALLVAVHEARVAAATKAMEEAVVATGQAGAATRRGQQAKALLAEVARFEQLWEASACLAKCHLLGTLREIHDLLSSPYGSSRSPGGPFSQAVAKRCQKAIEDIPRLLGDSDVTAVTS